MNEPNSATIIALIALGLNLFCLGILIDSLATSFAIKHYKQKIEVLEKVLEDNGLSEN